MGAKYVCVKMQVFWRDPVSMNYDLHVQPKLHGLLITKSKKNERGPVAPMT